MLLTSLVELVHLGYRRPVDHSSYFSASKAPTSRQAEALFGKVRSVYLATAHLLNESLGHAWRFGVADDTFLEEPRPP